MSKQQAQASAQTPSEADKDIDTSGWNEANLTIDGWYAPEVSGTVVGRAVEAIRITSAYGEQDVVKLRLGRAAVGIQGKGDAAEKVPLDKGDILGVRISANLSVLLELVRNECAVEITPTGKKKTGSGRQILTYKVKWKGERAPLAAPITRTQESTGGASDASSGDDDLPF